jgi:hypothetical protein
MTLDQLVSDLVANRPEFEPFDSYVIGMKRAVTPVNLEDPCLAAAASIFLNDLGAAHELVQDIEGNPMAAYLHGIIHRREGDFWNANYWFRQAKQISAELGLEPENLTHEVESSATIDEELRSKLLDEWKLVVRTIIN